MEKKQSPIEELARKTRLSVASVSRALHNCGSIKEDKKMAVVEAAREIQYTPDKDRRLRQNARWQVGVVLPHNPGYFWERARLGMAKFEQEHPHIQLRISLFSGMKSEKDALYCLEYMDGLKLDLLVVTPAAFEPVYQKLKALAGKVPVVLFNETAPVDGCFYVGANFYQDGIRLARAWQRTNPGEKRILRLCQPGSPMVEQRDRAFMAQMQGSMEDIRWAGPLNIGEALDRGLPAHLARAMDSRYRGSFDSVYVSQGFMAQAALAIHKLKPPARIPIIGYERPPDGLPESPYYRMAAAVSQDMFSQGYACLKAVHDYLESGQLPPGKKLFIPSRIADE